ncbi:MAG: hypothetical protein OEZ03_09055 [Alphaproteobacteria bacterium]|nr:hypothetical protein [Alphaproteobacteria bacterium]
MQNNGFRSPSDRLLAITVRCWRFLQRRRKIVAAVSIVGIAVVTATFVWWFLSGPKYTVAECLTGMQIHYPDGMRDRQREAILEKFLDFGGKYIFRDGGPAFSASVDENDRGRWYFLYRDKCENKHEMVQDFIDAFILAHPSDSIEITVIREPVRPTRYNAEFGDAWIDGRKVRSVE